MAKQSYSYSIGDTVLGEVRRRVGDDIDTDIEFMGEESLLLALNNAKKKAWRAPFTGLRIDPDGKITVRPTNKGWDFAEMDVRVSIVVKTTTTVSASAGATTLTLTSVSNIPSGSGAVVAYDNHGAWDYISYADRDTGTKQLTGIPASGLGSIGATLDSGVEIERLYKLPTDFERAKGLELAELPYYEGAQNPDPGYFCTHNGHLWVPRGTGATTGVFYYWKAPDDLAESSETLDTPDFLDDFLIHYLCQRAFHLGGAPQSVIREEQFAAGDSLQQALGFTVQTSSTQLRMKRAAPQQPNFANIGGRTSTFDSENY